MYIPLHVHDQAGSVGDSILKLENYIEKAKIYGLTALGLTNHGSLATMYSFYDLCKKNNIKPIIGNEMYLCLDKEEDLFRYATADTKERESISYKPSNYYHIVLIAKNNVGMKNLLFLTSHSSVHTFYKKPLISQEMLFAHSEGIICLTACIGGLFPKMIINKTDDNKIIECLKLYQSVFKDDFYLEVQPMQSLEQMRVNIKLAEFSKALNISLVATNDVHYLNKEDAIIHNIHVIDSREHDKPQKEKHDYTKLIYGDNCFYVMEEEQLQIPGIAKEERDLAILNTQLISEKCNVELSYKVQMPIFNPDQAYTEHLIKQIAYSKLCKITPLLKNPFLYSQRLEYELSVIKKLGFIDYFLIIWDVLRFAKENDIKIGPGRGSVNNSLLAYLLDITQVDSIKYNLMFERFLSEHRTSPPDIDLDIQSTRRDELFSYVQNKYGVNQCAQVRTLMIRGAKTAIKNAAKVLNLSASLAQQIADLIPTIYYSENGDGDTEQERDLSIERSLSIIPELSVFQEQYPDLFKYAIGLQDLTRSASIHAAGIVIYPYPLNDVLPLIRNKNGILATSLTLQDAEHIAIKFDFLGSKTLDFIDVLEKETGFKFNYEDEQLFTDEKVWEKIGSYNNAGLFQISSYTYRKRMPRIKPQKIEDLAACLALVRSPCIATKLDEDYMCICENKKDVNKIHPIYDKAVKDTKGIMIYQEQNMKLFENAGMTREDSFRLMKLLAKKEAEKAQHFKEQFYTCCEKHNMNFDLIEYIWNIVEKSAMYSFNCGHGTGYAFLCYVTAYYKTHYPKTFYTLLLTRIYRNEKTEKKGLILTNLVREMNYAGYHILLPDINQCNEDFKDIPNTSFIMAGTCAIKGFGSGLKNFVNRRDITTVEDLFNGRKSISHYSSSAQAKSDWKSHPIPSKKVVIAGIFAGLFDQTFGLSRQQLYEQYMLLRKTYADCKDEGENTLEIVVSNKEKLKIAESNEVFEKAFYSVNF